GPIGARAVRPADRGALHKAPRPCVALLQIRARAESRDATACRRRGRWAGALRLPERGRSPPLVRDMGRSGRGRRGDARGRGGRGNAPRDIRGRGGFGDRRRRVPRVEVGRPPPPRRQVGNSSHLRETARHSHRDPLRRRARYTRHVESLDLFIRTYGYPALFGSMVVEQFVPPIAGEPILLGAGALAGVGRLSLWLAAALALAGTIVGDLVWYEVGRLGGHRVLRQLCRVTIEPDSCVRRGQDTFARQGASVLLIAKFVPGLNSIGQPLA